jgi:transposase
VGDLSIVKLRKTRMAKALYDSGLGMLKNFLEYKSQQAARSFSVVSEQGTSVTCSSCGRLTGPHGVNGLIVRQWVCAGCGERHDRDINAARNILRRAHARAPACGNELPLAVCSVEEPRRAELQYGYTRWQHERRGRTAASRQGEERVPFHGLSEVRV